MGKRLKLIIPLLLPFFLSLFPVWLLWMENQQRQELNLEKFHDGWHRRAVDIAENLRADHRFENQMNRFNYDFRNRIGKFLNSRSSAKMSAELMTHYLHKIFPRSHLSKDSIVYGFSIDPGGKISMLKGPGLQTTKRTIFTRVFSSVLNVFTLDKNGKIRADKIFRGIFGELSRIDLFGRQRKGLISPVKFEGRSAFLIWDTVKKGDADVGGYFLVFFSPRSNRELNKRSLNYSLRKVCKPIPPFFQSAMLVPLAEAPKTTPFVVSRSLSKDSSVRRLIGRLRKGIDRDTLVPNGRTSERIDGLRIYRQFLALNFPYEIWIISPRHVINFSRGGVFAQILTALMMCGWIGVFARIIIMGEPLPIKMKAWFYGFFAAVGIFPIFALYLTGNLQIETAKSREIQEIVTKTTDTFSNLDTNSSLVFRRFQEESFGVLCVSKISKLLLDPSDENIQRFMNELRSNFSQFNLFRPTFYSFRSQRPQKVISFANREISAREMALIDFYSPFFDDGIKTMYPQWEPFKTSENDYKGSVMKSIQGSGFTGQDMKFHFLQMRGNGDLIEFQDEIIYQYYDFIGSGPLITSGIFLREIAMMPISQFFFQCFSSLSQQSPENAYALGKLVPGSYQPLFPMGDSFWRSGNFQKLRVFFHRCARTNKKLVHLDSEKMEAIIIQPSEKTPGFLLGCSIDLKSIFFRAGKKRIGLALGSLFLMLTIVFLGKSFSDFLLSPLAEVEQGLQKAASGDLTLQLKLSREDELGEMSARFDTMIGGLQKRQELGKFVSGTLEFELASGRSGQVSKSSRKIVSVLVSDIRDFTTISETYPVRDVVEMLNEHLAVMTTAITNHGGVIDKFIGDAIVAIFFAMTPQECVFQTLDGALEMTRQQRELQKARKKKGKFTYDIGIGVDFGAVIVGSLSSSRREEWLILGEPRTRAEFLEGESKKGSHTRIVVSKTLAATFSQRTFVPIPDSVGMELVETTEA